MAKQEIEPTDQEILRRLLEEGGGLEDLDPREGGISRIRIDHKDAMWVDSLTGLKVKEFEGVICGIVKQRVMFPPKMSKEPGPPECKSVDFKIGRPNLEIFPVAEFRNPAGGVAPGPAVEFVEGIELDCGTCPFEKFGSNPSPDKEGPRCTEQIILVVLADLDGSGNDMPSLLTAQKSALKPTRAYLAGFKRAGNPAFSHRTKFSLSAQVYAGNDYAVPVYKRLEETPKELWLAYGQTYTQNRDFLHTRRDVEQAEAAARPASPDDLPF